MSGRKSEFSRTIGRRCGSRGLITAPSLALPGSPPQMLLSEMAALGQCLGIDVLPKSQVRELFEPIPGLREAVLHDAIYLLHKAAHVLGSALVHVSSGMCTWSLSSAYQAAYFAMNSVMRFLGVAVVEYESRHFLIDV